MKNQVAILDYGLGNLLSIARAFEQQGSSVQLVKNPAHLKQATHLVLPGVGAFANGMKKLKEGELVEPILDWVSQGKPMMGICLGMQILLDKSYEFGEYSGLGVIPGSVKPISDCYHGQEDHKIPHIGWSEIYPSKINSWGSGYLSEIEYGEAFYFVHSYASYTQNPDHEIAYYQNNGIRIPAILQKENIIGIQFHPEKSGEAGLKILNSFMSSKY